MEQFLDELTQQLFNARVVKKVSLGNPRGAGLTWRLDLDNNTSVMAKAVYGDSLANPEASLHTTLADIGAPVPLVLGLCEKTGVLVTQYYEWPTFGTLLSGIRGNECNKTGTENDDYITRSACAVVEALGSLEQVCYMHSATLLPYVAKTDLSVDMQRIATGLGRFLQARLQSVGCNLLLHTYWEPLVDAALNGPLTIGAADYHAGNILVGSSPSQVLFLDWPHLSKDYPERRLVQYLSLPPLYSGISPAVLKRWEQITLGGAIRLAAHFRLYWGLVVSRLWVAVTQPGTKAAQSITAAWGDPVQLLPQAIAVWCRPLSEPTADNLIPILNLAFGNLPI